MFFTNLLGAFFVRGVHEQHGLARDGQVTKAELLRLMADVPDSAEVQIRYSAKRPGGDNWIAYFKPVDAVVTQQEGERVVVTLQ